MEHQKFDQFGPKVLSVAFLFGHFVWQRAPYQDRATGERKCFVLPTGWSIKNLTSSGQKSLLLHSYSATLYGREHLTKIELLAKESALSCQQDGASKI